MDELLEASWEVVAVHFLLGQRLENLQIRDPVVLQSLDVGFSVLGLLVELLSEGAKELAHRSLVVKGRLSTSARGCGRRPFDLLGLLRFGDGDGLAVVAQLGHPDGLAVDQKGSWGTPWMRDEGAHVELPLRLDLAIRNLLALEVKPAHVNRLTRLVHK